MLICAQAEPEGMTTAGISRVRELLLFPVGTDSAGDVAGNPSGGPNDAPPTDAVTLSGAAPAVGSAVTDRAAPPVTHQAAPPAAATVAAADVTEETLRLRAELDAERTARKRVETEHASVSDEFQRYKDATEARQTIPVKQGKVADSGNYRFLRRRA